MDMVSLNIVGGILVSICRDMGVTLMRTSYSTIFSESLDFTCGLALPSGELVATGDFCPSMIGGMPLLLRSCVQEIALNDLEEGDVCGWRGLGGRGAVSAGDCRRGRRWACGLR